MAFDLTKSKVLTFDVYATLIDWETGIFKQLAPLLGRLPPEAEYFWGLKLREIKTWLLKAFGSAERKFQTENPTMVYSKILEKVFKAIASELGIDITEEEATAFGGGIGSWPAFPDTVDALNRLQRFYKLVPLSNCDRASFNNTLAGPLRGVTFDAIYLAEDIGSYKPARSNFDYMAAHVERDFGFAKSDILHTAQSLSHDHVPAMEFGFPPSVWISRGADEHSMGLRLADVEGRVNLGATYSTLGEMADAAEKAFGASK
ncbi:HAD-like domain-containing protein [Bisporella sp. PMI_857]|nr:HAD-like domain-containing protein [Bisporella sp. PMI_857]